MLGTRYLQLLQIVFEFSSGYQRQEQQFGIAGCTWRVADVDNSDHQWCSSVISSTCSLCEGKLTLRDTKAIRVATKTTNVSVQTEKKEKSPQT